MSTHILTYDDRIERIATALQILDHADMREDFPAVAIAHERYMALTADAEAYCDANGIPRCHIDTDLRARLGLY